MRRGGVWYVWHPTTCSMSQCSMLYLRESPREPTVLSFPYYLSSIGFRPPKLAIVQSLFGQRQDSPLLCKTAPKRQPVGNYVLAHNLKFFQSQDKRIKIDTNSKIIITRITIRPILPMAPSDSLALARRVKRTIDLDSN